MPAITDDFKKKVIAHIKSCAKKPHLGTLKEVNNFLDNMWAEYCSKNNNNPAVIHSTTAVMKIITNLDAGYRWQPERGKLYTVPNNTAANQTTDYTLCDCLTMPAKMENEDDLKLFVEQVKFYNFLHKRIFMSSLYLKSNGFKNTHYSTDCHEMIEIQLAKLQKALEAIKNSPIFTQEQKKHYCAETIKSMEELFYFFRANVHYKQGSEKKKIMSPYVQNDGNIEEARYYQGVLNMMVGNFHPAQKYNFTSIVNDLIRAGIITKDDLKQQVPDKYVFVIDGTQQDVDAENIQMIPLQQALERIKKKEENNLPQNNRNDEQTRDDEQNQNNQQAKKNKGASQSQRQQNNLNFSRSANQSSPFSLIMNRPPMMFPMPRKNQDTEQQQTPPSGSLQEQNTDPNKTQESPVIVAPENKDQNSSTKGGSPANKQDSDNKTDNHNYFSVVLFVSAGAITIYGLLEITKITNTIGKTGGIVLVVSGVVLIGTGIAVLVVPDKGKTNNAKPNTSNNNKTKSNAKS